MISNEIQAYSDSLTQIGIKHTILEHPEFKTPAEAYAYFNLTIGNGIPTVIMKADDAFIAVLRRDDTRIDFKKLKQLVGKNVRMANPEEFVKLTGLPLGAARVYNPGLPTYIDDKIFEKEYLIGGSGNFICSIRYKTADLRKLSNSFIGSFTSGNEK